MSKLLKAIKCELHIIDQHFSQFLSSLGMIAIGASLFVDTHYFFFPPSLASMENDNRLDVVIIILGLGLLICTLTNNKSKGWTGFFLIMVGAVCLVIAGTQLIHAYYAGYFRMAHTVIGDFILFFLVLRAAYKS